MVAHGVSTENPPRRKVGRIFKSTEWIVFRWND